MIRAYSFRLDRSGATALEYLDRSLHDLIRPATDGVNPILIREDGSVLEEYFPPNLDLRGLRVYDEAVEVEDQSAKHGRL
jgi:hypothetical protein